MYDINDPKTIEKTKELDKYIDKDITLSYEDKDALVGIKFTNEPAIFKGYRFMNDDLYIDCFVKCFNGQMLMKVDYCEIKE